MMCLHFFTSLHKSGLVTTELLSEDDLSESVKQANQVKEDLVSRLFEGKEAIELEKFKAKIVITDS